MALESQSITIYSCDSCGQEIELAGAHGLSAPFPTGWMQINGFGPTGDVFCSWRCLGDFSLLRAEEVEARAAARAAAKETAE